MLHHDVRPVSLSQSCNRLSLLAQPFNCSVLMSPSRFLRKSLPFLSPNFEQFLQLHSVTAKPYQVPPLRPARNNAFEGICFFTRNHLSHRFLSPIECAVSLLTADSANLAPYNCCTIHIGIQRLSNTCDTVVPQNGVGNGSESGPFLFVISLVREDDRGMKVKGGAAVIETVVMCGGRENQTINYKIDDEQLLQP